MQKPFSRELELTFIFVTFIIALAGGWWLHPVCKTGSFIVLTVSMVYLYSTVSRMIEEVEEAVNNEDRTH